LADVIVKIKTSDLKPGQVIAEDVYDKFGRPLVYCGAVLSPFSIKGLKLRSYISYVKIKVPFEEAPEGFIRPEESISGVPSSVEQKIGNFFKRARTVDQIDSRMIEEISRDIKPVIDKFFDSEPMVLDSLQLLAGHDDHTHQHCWMVMLLTLSVLRLAEQKGVLRPDYQDKINAALGSLLHDVGKTKVPLEILLKPGKLTEEEFRIVKRHPTFGYRMVVNTPNLMPVPKAIVAHHHRYLDGTGYSAEGVPLPEHMPDLVRIVTVADIYDAIVSERPYHVAALPFHALKILEQGAGTRFDPRFIALLRDSVAAFPIGSFLLFRGGILCQVNDVDRHNKDIPLLHVIGSFSKSGSNLLGKTFWLDNSCNDLPKDHDIFLGAYSPESLAGKIRGSKKFGESYAEMLGSGSSWTLDFLSEYSEIMHHHFSFLTEIESVP
jgi:HD-GYP domain-containing protein (c-di-GMP phosphodiesterase class II)